MDAAKKQHAWTDFLKFYAEQNDGRLTRLGVFENEGGVVNDYWIEDGLPLTGISIEAHGHLPTVEIMLGNYTHTVKNARNLKINFGLEETESGFDITDAQGRTTILRFENSGGQN